MEKRSITFELDDETLQRLGALGDPRAVLAELAHAVANGAGPPSSRRRGHTDQSLRIERDNTDRRAEGDRAAEDGALAVERARADDAQRPSESTVAEGDARATRAVERAAEDDRIASARADRRRVRDSDLAFFRTATDTNLNAERWETDAVHIDQREANGQLVSAAIRAQELAEEAERAKTRAESGERELREIAEFREMFIGIVGHDLRTPLGSIVMGAGLMLSRGHLTEQDAETASRIIRSSQRMAQMVTQLLDLTRARLGGGLPIAPKPTDLHAVCRLVVQEFDVSVRLETEGELTGIWDEDRLAEVLSNLTGNALEHATRGTPVIVRARSTSASVFFEVENAGEPIPDDVLPFIFEPFRRAKPFAKSPAGNLGLGLYIAKQIVLAHGGVIDARSAGGVTVFSVSLPRVPPLR